jgi:hypothetical protein
MILTLNQSQRFFSIEVRNVVNSRFTRDLSEASPKSRQDSASSPSPSAARSVEWRLRESIYKSSETDEMPSAKT